MYSFASVAKSLAELMVVSHICLSTHLQVPKMICLLTGAVLCLLFICCTWWMVVWRLDIPQPSWVRRSRRGS